MSDTMVGNYADADRPLPECLIRRLDQLRRFLSRRRERFSPWVIELALDRVVRAALPYFDQKACQLADPKSRMRWIFAAALKAARQVAFRQIPCDLLEPSKLEAVAPPCRRRDEERHEALHHALSLLTRLQREALDLCVLKEFSLLEAATRMGRSPNTVKFHRDAALKRLAVLLEKTSVHCAPAPFVEVEGEE